MATMDRREYVEWTAADDRYARSRGWAFFESTDGNGIQLQAIDLPGIVNPEPLCRFVGADRDAQAIDFVQRLADAGEPVCRKAIDFIFRHGQAAIDFHQVKRNW